MARLVSSESLKCSRIELMITNWYSFSPIEWQFHELIFFHQMIPDFTMCKFISPLENTHSPNDRFHEVNFHQVISPRCLHPRYFGKMANPALKFGSTKCDTIIYMFMQHESLLWFITWSTPCTSPYTPYWLIFLLF